MGSENHECEILRNSKTEISINKIVEKWYWIRWNDKKGNQADGVKFCPYCGQHLE